nr:hypothetical protein [Tanacetum cinerariifolium]
MSTRSSTRILFPPLEDPERTIRRRTRVDPNLLNNFYMATKGNGDNQPPPGGGDLPVPDLRTTEELCQPTLNGRGGPIAPIAIQATNFRLKNDMIQQVQNSCQFYGLPGDDANKHLDKFLHVTQSIKLNGVTDNALRLYLFPHSLTYHATAWFDHFPRNSITTFEQMAKMFLEKYFPPSTVTKLRNEITNFCQRPDESLSLGTHRDTINVAASETFMKRRPEECYDLIKNMTAHHNDWDTSAQRSKRYLRKGQNQSQKRTKSRANGKHGKVHSQARQSQSPVKAEKHQNVRLVELCTLRTIVVLMGVSETGSFVILIRHPTYLNDPPPQNCPKCGNMVDGHYCKGCALLRKKFKEDLFTYCIENGILQDSSEPSNDNTNVVNALQEPFVVVQDLGENSSRSPPQINHHCCYECGDSLEDIFCHKCTCELCRRGAHYGYNCPSKVSVVSNPEPCHNQNVDELPQTLPSFDPTCYSEDGNSFTYVSTSNLVHKSPNIFDPPLQPLIYSYEFCGNDAYYGYDCSLRYSVVPQPPQEEISVEFLQEKRNQMDFVKTFLRKFNRISFYEMPKVLSLAWETLLEIKLAFLDKHCQPKDILELFQRLHNDVQNIHEELEVGAHNSLSMWDEHLDTIPAMESDNFIKFSVENLVPIPSESKGIPDNMCDMPFHDNSPPLDISKDQFKDFSDSNDESTSIDDDSFSIDDIEYVEASSPDSELVSSEVMEIVIPKVGGIDDDILLTIKNDILREKLLNVNLFIANIEALKDNPIPSSDFMTKSSSTSLNSLLEETNTFDNSLPEFETFCFYLEDISSGSTTTHSDISLQEYEAFYDDHVKEISSGSTTTYSDSSLYDSFIFDLSINPFPPAGRSDFYEFVDELVHIISPPEYDCF